MVLVFGSINTDLVARVRTIARPVLPTGWACIAVSESGEDAVNRNARSGSVLARTLLHSGIQG